MTDAERIRALKAARPDAGLFADLDWRISPRPLTLDPTVRERIERLGPLLHEFQKACNRLYLASAQGRMPAWIASLLDAGKPAALVAFSREARLKNALPEVLRPDLLLTAGGLRLSELDTVPGGIGATTWMQEAYARLDGHTGPAAMRTGWEAMFPEGDIVVSREAGTYRPEMEWLTTGNPSVRVVSAEDYDAGTRPIYRFFEAFDLPNLPRSSQWCDAVLGGTRMTAPLKPFLEEKLWAALFWNRTLQSWWRTELGEKHQTRLRELIPFSWVLDPEPLPPHGVYPRLDIHAWDEMGAFSQKQRRLVLKVSGFSERAWGARGVVFGHDVSGAEWKAEVSRALAEFPRHPHVLQVFEESETVTCPWGDPDSGEIRVMNGRARLCPYFFVVNDKPQLGGILATVCPPDKKALHGMRDAIMTLAV